MKTITEFNSFDLQAAAQALQEFIRGGKTPEEAQQAFADQKKIEGEKLKFYINAIEILKKTHQPIKRIVVMQPGEGEKVPSGLQKIEDHYFLTEYFPEASKRNASRERPRGPKRGRGKREAGGRRDRPRPSGESPGARAPQNQERQAAPAPHPKRRPPRPPRAPRPVAAPNGFVIVKSETGGLVLKPKEEVPQPQAESSAPAASITPSS